MLLFSISLFAQFTSASFQYIGYKLPYQIMYPENYDSSKRYPLVVFLHGAGERGNDNQKQLTHGKQFLIDNEINGRSEFTFGLTDKPTRSMETLISLVNWWVSSGLIDTNRIYVGGLSMGGMGTFELLWRMPNTFAAAFPICGGSANDILNLYAKNTAVWIFHGEVDNVVSPDFSRNAYNRLKELGCDVKYTEYEGVNHGSWNNVFAEKELIPWLFDHKKN